MTRALSSPALVAAFILSTSIASGSGVFELSGSSYTADHGIFESNSVFSDGDQKANLIGGDITFGSVNASTGGLLFTLGGAYGTFDSTIDPSLIPNGSFSDLTDENHVAIAHIMLGYRYNYRLSNNISLFAGAHIGASSMGIAPTASIITSPISGQITSIEDSYDYDFGYIYVLETGVSVYLTEGLYLFASYQFSNSTATPEIKLGSGESIKVKEQSYQTIRAGIGFSF